MKRLIDLESKEHKVTARKVKSVKQSEGNRLSSRKSDDVQSHRSFIEVSLTMSLPASLFSDDVTNVRRLTALVLVLMKDFAQTDRFEMRESRRKEDQEKETV